MIGELLVRPAMELAELLRSGRVHARELVEAALRRLEDRERRVNAFCFVDAPDRRNDPLVTEGVLTRTVANPAALLDVPAGYEAGDVT